MGQDCTVSLNISPIEVNSDHPLLTALVPEVNLPFIHSIDVS